MWWLQFVGDSVKRLGIITGLVLLFTAILTAGTNAQPHQVLVGRCGVSFEFPWLLRKGTLAACDKSSG